MNIRVGAAAAVLVVFAAGCVGTGEAVTPTSTTEPTPGTTLPPAETTPASAAPEEPVGSTTTTAEDPWPGVHPDFDFEQNGLIAPEWDSEAYGSDEFALDLEELAATGAEWVTLVPTWYQADVTTSEIQPEWQGRTATDAALSAAIERSRDLSLKVALKPHVDLSEGGPRATIEPADTNAWFTSYTDFITHYAELAEEADADELIVGTELAGTVEATSQWRQVIEEVRSVYSGPVLYAANWDEYQRVEFWDALDAIGIDAYFPLADLPTTDVSTLMEAWGPIVEELAAWSKEQNRPVVFTEAGYTSQEGTVTHPHEAWWTAILSEEEQVAAYTALLTTFEGQPWFAGTHWWMWFDYEGDEFAKSMGHTPQGKLAEDVLREAWATTR